MAKEKKMTLERLARMVSAGFDQTATDVKGLATKADVKAEIGSLRHEMIEGFKRVELHISSLGSDWKERFDALEMRVRKLEHRR